MTHADHCDTVPSHKDSVHTDTCYDFNNYADAHVNGCGYNDSNPPLCPGVFQGSFHVDNTACHADVNHTNVAYSHTAFGNVYYHTPYSHTAFGNVYYHTPYSHTAFGNVYYHTPYYHTSFYNSPGYSDTPHTHSCTGSYWMEPGWHYNWTACGYFCNYTHKDSVAGYKSASHYNLTGSHSNTSYSHTPHKNSAFSNSYSHTPHKNVTFSNSYSHTPHKNVTFSNSYSHTPHKNVAYSHTPFVDFCNHTDHNAG